MISGVWLNRLWLEKKVQAIDKSTADSPLSGGAPIRATTVENTLHLTGSVIAAGGDETAAIGKFIRSLENNEGFFRDFREINSASIQRAKLKDEEVMNFELICYFK